jgi:trans-2-enoyl-CoA reductase
MPETSSGYGLAKRTTARFANAAAATADDCESDACQCRDAKAYQDCFFHNNTILSRLKMKFNRTFRVLNR